MLYAFHQPALYNGNAEPAVFRKPIKHRQTVLSLDNGSQSVGAISDSKVCHFAGILGTRYNFPSDHQTE